MIAIEDIDTSIKKDIIVEGLMRSRGVYLLVSPPKVGKSNFAIQLTYSFSNGLPFLGLRVTASPVLYITTESDKIQISERLKYMKLKPKEKTIYIIDRDEKEKISLFDIQYKLADFSDPDKNKILIIDMMKDINFGIKCDYNDFQVVTQELMPKIRYLADKYNFTILLTHHLNKRNETLGSTGFNACVDGVFTLKQKNENYIQFNTISRDFAPLDLLLERNENLILNVCKDDEDEIIDPNLILFIKYASTKKEFELSATDIVKEANLFCTPKSFGKKIRANIELLKQEGLAIQKCKNDQRYYKVKYEEPTIDN